MLVKRAVDIFVKKYPALKINGYWKKTNGIVLNTVQPSYFSGLDVPGQYLVTDTGDIYATNPMRSDLSSSTMKVYKENER